MFGLKIHNCCSLFRILLDSWRCFDGIFDCSQVWRTMIGSSFHPPIGRVRYGSTCRDGTSPRSSFCSTPSAYSGRPPGPAPGPLTIPSYDHPTALTTTRWDAPAGDSTQPDRQIFYLSWASSPPPHSPTSFTGTGQK